MRGDYQNGSFAVLLLVISMSVGIKPFWLLYANSPIICIAYFLLWALWTTFIHPFFISPLRHLPMPKGNHWLWGHGMKLYREPQGNPAKEWLTATPHNGIIRYLTFFNRERLIVYSPNALADVLHSNCYDFQKPAFLSRPMQDILGNGLLLSEGDDHRAQKKGLSAAFTRRNVKSLYPIICSKARETIVTMCTGMPSDKEVEMDIADWASRYALDTIGLAGFGKDFGAILDRLNPLVRMYENAFKVTRQKRVLFFLGALLPWSMVRSLPLQHNRDFSHATRTIRQKCREIIQEKRGSLYDTQENYLLLNAIKSNDLSEKELVNQVMTFLGAGHETTASILTWTVFALALHPKIQQELREEIKSNLEPLDSGHDYPFDRITRLPFLSAVCNEVFRMFPPVRLTMREAIRDTFVQGVAIPCGIKIMIPPCATNMDEKLWGADAADFNPYRWLVKDGEGGFKFNGKGGTMSTNYAMLTFSQGHRICIGQGFAKAEFTCMLAAWIERFHFTLKDKDLLDISQVKFASGITVKPESGMRVCVKIVPRC